uniref:Transmembrane protein n=1 Tax=Steinernema glaseri TaxID=37863 RepID=A0A1I7ZAG8_9BILA
MSRLVLPALALLFMVPQTTADIQDFTFPPFPTFPPLNLPTLPPFNFGTFPPLNLPTFPPLNIPTLPPFTFPPFPTFPPLNLETLPPPPTFAPLPTPAPPPATNPAQQILNDFVFWIGVGAITMFAPLFLPLLGGGGMGGETGEQ